MVKIIVTTIMEVMGSPKEHVDETLQLLMKKLKDDKTFKFVKGDMFDAVPVEKTPLFTGFVDVELEFKKFEELTGFCFDYYPSSIEIIEPENLNIKNNELSLLFNDIAARLHKTHKLVREIHASNRLLSEELQKYKKEETK